MILFSCDQNHDQGLDLKGDYFFIITDGNDSSFSNNQYVMHLRTQKSYNEGPQEILLEWNKSGSKININIMGVKGPDLAGYPGLTFGRATVDLNLPTGEYELTFLRLNESNNHIISVGDDTVDVTMLDSSFTEYYPPNWPWF